MTTRTLIFVGAHPDDDAFTVSGSVALLRDDPSCRFVLVLATDGEDGEIAPDVAVPRARLGRHRRAEDEASWLALGRVPDRTVWLGLPDSRLDGLPAGLLSDAIADVLADERPDVVTTFGPDGLTGHPDHIAVGAATTAAFHRVLVAGEAASRLLYSALPRSRFDTWNHDLAQRGLPTWDPRKTYHFRPVPDERIHVDVDCTPYAERRLAAVRAHRSQWSYAAVPAAADRPLARSLAGESWTLAWPAPSNTTTRSAHLMAATGTLALAS